MGTNPIANSASPEMVPSSAVAAAVRGGEIDGEPTYCRILVLAAPLVLSATGMMLMQVIDAIFLARYSQVALAASVTAGLAGWSACALFVGLAGYTSVFVAQYIGAGRPERVGAAVWQGIWFSFGAGLAVALVGLASNWLFRQAGHSASVWTLEARYFRILCFGGIFSVLGCALSGFFSGRGDNLTLGLVQLAGLAVNALMSWLLIFGRWGWPELGAAGAAIGTVIGQAVVSFGLGVILVLPRYGRSLGTWNLRLEWGLQRRLLRYGLPAGVRMWIEITVWTLFTSFIGRLGTEPQAATGLAFRVNALAFFPLFGIGMAISTLVGQGQGMHRPDLGQRATTRSGIAGLDVQLRSVVCADSPAAARGISRTGRTGRSGLGAHARTRGGPAPICGGLLLGGRGECSGRFSAPRGRGYCLAAGGIQPVVCGLPHGALAAAAAWGRPLCSLDDCDAVRVGALRLDAGSIPQWPLENDDGCRTDCCLTRPRLSLTSIRPTPILPTNDAVA